MAIHLQRGQRAEAYALDFLQQHGLSLVQKNYSCKLGEIDLIMRDYLVWVFVEVRFRRSSQYGSAVESVSPYKQKRLRKTALHYVLRHKAAQQQDLRFDVIGINHNFDIDWIKNAF